MYKCFRFRNSPVESVRVLPILALNEIYIGESLSSRVSYLEVQVLQFSFLILPSLSSLCMSNLSQLLLSVCPASPIFCPISPPLLLALQSLLTAVQLSYPQYISPARSTALLPAVQPLLTAV
jgi:hypothetical protein